MSTPPGPTDLMGERRPSAEEAVARLRLRMRDRSLADLAAAGLLVYDRETNVVRKGPNFQYQARPVRPD